MLHLEHYYKIFILNERQKVAVSFLATAFGGNRLVAIINEDGHNEGIVEVDLDLMVKNVKINTTVYSSGGEKGADARLFLPFDFTEFQDRQLQNLPESLMKLFNHLNP